MKMYVACLASYNAGRHHGAWFDLSQYSDAADLQDDIARRVLHTSPCPNVTVECPHCETGRRGMGCAEGQTFRGRYECKHCDSFGNLDSAEEWAAHDYDGDELDQFGEYPNLEKLLEHVETVEEHGDAWLAYVEHVGAHYATVEGFKDAHLGDCEDAEEFFTERLEDTGELNQIPEYLRHYFDFKAYARDQEINGGYAFVEYNGTTYVFCND